MKVVGGKRSAPTGPRRTHVPRPGGAHEFETFAHSCALPGRGVFNAVEPVGAPLARLPTGYPHRPLRGPFGAYPRLHARSVVILGFIDDFFQVLDGDVVDRQRDIVVAHAAQLIVPENLASSTGKAEEVPV